MGQLINKTESFSLFNLSTKLRKGTTKSQYVCQMLSATPLVFIALHKDSTPTDQLCACIQAEVLEFIFTHRTSNCWNDKVCNQLP